VTKAWPAKARPVRALVSQQQTGKVNLGRARARAIAWQDQEPAPFVSDGDAEDAVPTWQRLLAAVWLSLAPEIVHAGSFPAAPVTFVVTAAPGGVTDLLARALGQRVAKNWGQPIVVVNRPGASNQIGAEYVARSTPDGYTLLVSAEATFVVNPWLYSKLPYRLTDFAPITGLVSISQALIASPSVPANSLNELIALARQQPGELNYGTFGIGSTGHLNMEMLQNMTGVKLVAVHYKGASPALVDVTAGHIQMMFISTSSAVQPWKAGHVKLLAVGSSKRLSQFPEIATVAESGLPGFEAVSWFGLFAPGGTPREIVDRINVEVRRAFADAEFREKFLAPHMFEPMVDSPEEFAAFIASETQKWGEVVRSAKVRLD
jgi:tripartite-type tricarboxylate transporter receptor subunit TctC